MGGSENSQPAIYRTTDGGTSWSKLTATGLAGTVYALAVRPDNPSTILAGTSSGIYRSLDDGSSFTKVSTTISYVKTIVFDPAQPGVVYIGTNSQGVWRSTDGGTGWSAFNTGLTETGINRLATCGPAYLLAGTNGGSSFRCGIGVGVSEESSAPVTTARLSVWPNPADGPAGVAFDLSEPGPVTLSVFDLHGRLVATPLEGSLPSGPHSVLWDARREDGTDAPPGIYLVVLGTGQGQISGRLVLTR